MNNFILEVIGDTNDADYATSTTQFKLDEMIELPSLVAPNGDQYDRQDMTVIDFFTMFALALKDPRTTRHVWSREKWDSDKATRETVKLFAKRLYGIDIEEELSDEVSDEKYNYVHEYICEILSDYMPYNVHSICSISFYPEFNKTYIHKR